VRKLLIIASREYLSYARTVGFWLSLTIMPLAFGAAAFLPTMMERATPARTLAVADLTGQHMGDRLRGRLQERAGERRGRELIMAAMAAEGREAGEAVGQAFDKGGEAAARATFARVAPEAAKSAKAPPELFRLVELPSELPGADLAQVNAVMRPYIAGERTLPDGTQLDAAAVLYRDGDSVAVDLWTANLNDAELEGEVRAALRDELRKDRLMAAGMSPDFLARIQAITPKIRVLSPRAHQGEVSFRDRLPAIVGFALGLVLWSAVLTGASILLNSVMEEKSNRVLEILAASATTVELMGGKILGVACLALTLLGAWGLIGASVLLSRFPGVGADLQAVLFGEGFLLYFALYAVLGYLMYAAAFAAIGAFCETTRDAQALLGPVMLLLTIPVFFMSLALREPDAPILRILSWIPPFTPFIMLPRAAGEVAWWEIAGTLALMAAFTALVVQLSGRAFHAGAISTARMSPKAWLARRFGKRPRASARG
jgi:ABC-2 type transport system permease protein